MRIPREKMLEPLISKAVHSDEIDTMTQFHDKRVLELTALCRIADSLSAISIALQDIDMHIEDLNDSQ